MTTIRTVEVLYWDGCPSHEEAIERVRSVLDERGSTAELVIREVTSDEEAEALHFPGSPTIRVDGRDVDSVGAAARSALTCRIYRSEDGRVSPLPSHKQIRDALR